MNISPTSPRKCIILVPTMKRKFTSERILLKCAIRRQLHDIALIIYDLHGYIIL